MGGMPMLRRTPARAVALAVGVTVAFEAFLISGFAAKSLEAGAPWQDDPFHAWVSLAVFAVPALLAVTMLRMTGALLPWGRPASAGRLRDVVRACLVLSAFHVVTACVCWLAVVLRADRSSWDGHTPWLVGALMALTVPLPATVVLCRWSLRELPDVRDGDWVGDVLPPSLASWVRRNDRLVFLGASVVAALGIIGALAYGERWTDPLLIGWALAVEVTCYYAFCVLTNAVLGFIARPERDRRTERAVVVGSLAFQAAVAWHGQLEPVLGFGSPDGVPRLAQVTMAPGLLVFAVAFAWLRLRPAARARPAR
jgi:hypothetical protein